MIEEDIRTFLLADATLAGLVVARVYPTKMPPKSLATGYPAVTYFRVAGQRDQTHDAVDGLRFSRFQFNCWGKTYSDAKTTAAALTARLDHYRGAVGNSTVSACFVEDEADLLDPALAVGTDVPHGVRVDVKLIHTPA